MPLCLLRLNEEVASLRGGTAVVLSEVKKPFMRLLQSDFARGQCCEACFLLPDLRIEILPKWGASHSIFTSEGKFHKGKNDAFNWCSSGVSYQLQVRNEKNFAPPQKMCDNGAVYICYRGIQVGLRQHAGYRT